MPQFLAVLACAAVVVQGGYFPAFFLWAGAALGASLLVNRRRLLLPRPMWALGALALWQLLAALVNRGGLDSLSQASLPLVCWLYGLALLSLSGEERRQVLVWAARFGCVAAGAAIFVFLLELLGFPLLPGAVTAKRLQFTFQYANAAGSWFAALLLLRGELKDRWLDRLWPVLAAALLLTRSVGAIALCLILQAAVLLLERRRDPKVWLSCGGLALAGVLAAGSRALQALGTLAERLVQSADALKGMAASPLFGYGAGNWGEVKAAFQSYDYRAQVVHNSYAQAGVEGGFPAALLLAGAVILALLWLRGRSGAHWGAALMLPLHAVMDFTLCFFSIDALALAILAPAAPEEGPALPRRGGIALGCLTTVFFVLLALLRLGG